MNFVHASHPIKYKEKGEAIRLEASCQLHFYNYQWYKNGVHINLKRGYCLEYHCIQAGTFGSYACTYQDSNGTLDCEEFHLMPTRPALHPLHITPHSLSRHSTQLEPHPSVRKLRISPQTAETIPPFCVSRGKTASPQLNQQQPARICSHSSIQGPLYTPVPASCVRESIPLVGIPSNYSIPPEVIPSNYSSPPEVIPSNYSSPPEAIPYNYSSPPEVIPSNYSSPPEAIPSNYSSPPEVIPSNYSSGAPSRNTAYYSQEAQRGMFPQTIRPVIQHSLRIDPHPSCWSNVTK